MHFRRLLWTTRRSWQIYLMMLLCALFTYHIHHTSVNWCRNISLRCISKTVSSFSFAAFTIPSYKKQQYGRGCPRCRRHTLQVWHEEFLHRVTTLRLLNPPSPIWWIWRVTQIILCRLHQEKKSIATIRSCRQNPQHTSYSAFAAQDAPTNLAQGQPSRTAPEPPRNKHVTATPASVSWPLNTSTTDSSIRRHHAWNVLRSFLDSAFRPLRIQIWERIHCAESAPNKES